MYAYDGAEPVKQVRARQVLAAGGWVISAQVLQEFFVAVTRHLNQPLAAHEALAALEDLARGNVVAADHEMVIQAAKSSLRYQLSLWDAMIVQAARRAGCERLLTEDLNDGQIIDDVAVENPFVV